MHVHAVQRRDGEEKHTTHMHIISKMHNLQDYLKPDYIQSDLGCVHTKTKNQGGHVAVVQQGGLMKLT